MNEKSGYPTQGGPFESQLPDWFPRTRDTWRCNYAEIWARFPSEPSPPAANLNFDSARYNRKQAEGLTRDNQCGQMVAQAAGPIT